MTNTKTKKRIGLDMTEGNILHQLIQFAISLLLANLFQQLYNVLAPFATPSSAAMFVLGGSANGWIEWKNAGGKTLDEMYRK